MVELSIVIVNWNSADYLQACLTSLYRNVTDIAFEIVVVDNDSNDGCEAMLATDFPQVQFIAAKQNLGFARACNLGYECSRGETILFLNPDTETEANAIERMVAWLTVHPTVGAVGARLLNTDRSLQDNCVQAVPTLLNQLLDSNLLRRWFPGSSLWGTKALLDPKRLPAKVECISGACFMVRRDVFEAVGRFNADYFMYSDDLDLSCRIRRAGYSIVYLPDCEIIHHGGRSSSRRADAFADVAQRRSMAHFFRLTQGPHYSAVYRALTLASALCRLSVVLIAILFAGSHARRTRLCASLHKWLSILSWGLGMEEDSMQLKGVPKDDGAADIDSDEPSTARQVPICENRPHYAIVTPVRDEEAYIGAMIESIARQTTRPDQWIIVDDGSRDRTAAIIQEYAREWPFIHLIRLQPREQRLAGGEGAVPTGLRHLDLNDLDYLARLDADLIFPPDYFAAMFDRFRMDATLGIAGGILYIEKTNKLVPERDSADHVRGALKLYRRECFLDIGGLSTQIGWDTLDEVSAMAHGWKARSFDDLAVIHRRPTGQGIAAYRVFRQRGRGEYLTWSDPLFVFGKAVKITVTEISLLKPVCYLWGFLWSYLLREPRAQNEAIARIRRSIQRNRMAKMIRPFAKRSGRTNSALSS